MLGIGEFETEVIKTMDDLLLAGVKVLTYRTVLPPSRHTRLGEYIKPEVFEQYKQQVCKRIPFIESGPLVRSSYHAERHINI